MQLLGGLLLDCFPMSVRFPEAKALTPGQLARSQSGIEHARRMLANYRIGGNVAAALERILRRCRRHGTRVVLVGAPVTSWHRTAYTTAIDAAYRAYLRRLCRQHDCRFVDYRGRVPDFLFLDAHHLSPEGAVYFSRLLAREVLGAAR